jgi:hypothetical protein
MGQGCKKPALIWLKNIRRRKPGAGPESMERRHWNLGARLPAKIAARKKEHFVDFRPATRCANGLSRGGQISKELSISVPPPAECA